MKIDKNIDSLEETKALAENLAKALEGKQALIVCKGDLGAGKTTFTKYLGKALGVKKIINSPTFTILKSYRMADGRNLHHMDVYRMEGMNQDLGFEECFEENAICIVEWPQFIKSQLPKKRIELSIFQKEGEKRLFSFETEDETFKKLLEDLA